MCWLMRLSMASLLDIVRRGVKENRIIECGQRIVLSNYPLETPFPYLK